MNRTAAADTATEASTRRSLLRAAMVGAAAALVTAREANASPFPPDMSGGDAARLAHAMTIELTTRDLYRAAVDAGADPDVLGVIGAHHASYGQAIAGFAGVSANRANADLFDSLEADFASSNVADVAAAGFDVESALIATHAELLAQLESSDAAKLIASIIAVESRHCIVLADLAGRSDDVDALLENTASPILPEEQP